MDPSTEDVEDAVVVGVTGPGKETAALRFAAAYAARQRVPVVLVHAYGAALPPPPPSVLLTYAEAADIAEWVVEGVDDEFRELTQGAVPFRTTAVVGMPSHVLAGLSRQARFVIVQHRDAHVLGRFFVGSTVSGTAAHGECPVVSVPPQWEPTDTPGPVVVGVHEGGAPLHVVSAGLDWAAATKARVRVIHAWRLDAAYDDIVTPRVAEDWHDEQLRALESSISELRAAHPTVPVDVEVRRDWPTQALVGESEEASLVVVGRHAGHWRASTHLGSVTRTVMRESACPVMVVPPPTEAGARQDWDLDPDEVSPQM